MFRRLSLALAIAAALAPVGAYALGLGEIHPKSYLNQAFSADIDLLSVASDELDSVKVELASLEVFQRAGVPRPFYLSKLEFVPVATPDGKTIIRVSSRELIREPFLNFMIEVNWPKGRAVKEYTVLLDPPVVSQRRPKPVTAPSVAPRSAVKRGAPASAKTATAAAGALEYGPTKPNDTLWSIAKGMGVEGASVEQVLMALYRHNPNAFIGNNVNRLKVGQVLRLPAAEAAFEQGRGEARAELLAQSEAWRAQPPSATAAAPAVEQADEASAPLPLQPPDAAAEVPEAPSPAEPELKLVGTDEAVPQSPVPEGATGEMSGDPDAESEGEPGAGSLERDLLLAREEAAVARQEAIEMRDRIGELEDRLGEMQRLMTVQNDRLAQLQDQAEEAAAQPEPVAASAAPQGFVARLMGGDGVTVGLLGAIGALLLGLVALLVRGRKREEAAPPRATSAADGGASAGDQSKQTAAYAATAAAVAGAAATGGAVTEPAPAAAEEQALDPLAEVDVYVAYGRYEQAEEMLRQEIQHHPDRLDYQYKLLEIYSEGGNREAFVAQAEAMSQAGAETQDPEAWGRVVEMGRSLAPELALFGGTRSAAEAGSARPAPEPETENDFDLDLDLDLAGPAEPEAPAQTAADGLDFDLGDFDFEAGGQAAPEAAEDLPPAESADLEAPEAVDLAMGGEPEVPEEEVEGLSLEDVGGLLEVPPAPREEPEEPEELTLDTDAFVGGGEEEVETKIDLALAYQDMGDPDDARVILEEVLREGNEAQQQRARELLQALS